MLNIVVVCGGTGSIQLQKGLDEVFGRGRYNLDVIINAYDNGKSTGVCRRVYNNAILGPSDLRKNHLTEFSQKAKESAALGKFAEFMNLRISANSPQEYENKALDCIDEYATTISKVAGKAVVEEFRSYIRGFFSRVRSSESLMQESFQDFAISNIFYAHAAHINGDSLGLAGKRMTEILGIKNGVHLVSDVSLMLKAETESGYIVSDEADIVGWSHPDDKIVRVILEDPVTGKEYIPTIDEKSYISTANIMKNADVIILSSGTQWSSLIPTYVHTGFAEAFASSKAKKYLVMNNIQDKDMLGVNGTDLVKTAARFIDLKDTTIVLNSNASESMKTIDVPGIRTISHNISKPGDKIHIPRHLVRAIFADYYGINTKNGDNVFFFDLDGTLYDSRFEEVTTSNLSLLHGNILSGNTEAHVREILSRYAPSKRCPVYCDYGNTRFVFPSQHKEILCHDFVIDEDDDFMKDLLVDIDYGHKVKNFGGSVIHLKPFVNRPEHAIRVQNILNKNFSGCIAIPAGNTSIDIMRRELNKGTMLKTICANIGIPKEKVVYIGNEFSLQDSNDEPVRDHGFRCIEVKDVFETSNILNIIRQ